MVTGIMEISKMVLAFLETWDNFTFGLTPDDFDIGLT